MKETFILDRKFRELIQGDIIRQRIEKMADDINRDFEGRQVVFIGILNGVFVFAADLFRKIKLNARISFVKLESYRGTSSTGSVKELIGISEDLSNMQIIVLDDIIDTGFTLQYIIDELKKRKAGDIRIAALFFKPAAYKVKIPIDYIGFEIPNDFVVGYGMDYEGYGRNLYSVYSLIK
jgi:hypoxanthine phosphoribosyltransferase